MKWNEMKRVSDFGREVQSLCFALNSGITPNVSLPCNHSVQIHSLQERGCKNKDAIVRHTRQTRVKPCPRSSSKLVLTISESQKVSAEEDMLILNIQREEKFQFFKEISVFSKLRKVFAIKLSDWPRSVMHVCVNKHTHTHTVTHIHSLLLREWADPRDVDVDSKSKLI